MQSKKILLIGNSSAEHVGAHFLNSAKRLGIPVHIIDTREAYQAPRWLMRISWWLRGHRPTWLNTFSRKVLEACRTYQPWAILTTGISPVSEEALEKIGRLGVKRLNFLTDDPWNPANRATFFFSSLQHYDMVFSTRQANLEDLCKHGCKKVEYLPFAYAPEIHFQERIISEEDRERFTCDISFIGGADDDRVAYVSAIAKKGFNLKLYGGYWNRYSELRPFYKGFVLQSDLRKAVAGSKVSLCLVRRANRDGHAMRSYEFPAMGACMLVEDTDEHRALFGQDGEAVLYFRDIQEMLSKLEWLLSHESERHRMADAARTLIINGHHTYADRLKTMLNQALERENQITYESCAK